MLDPNEIQELDIDLKANEWGAETLLKIENVYELLIIFQMFCYINGRFSLTNGLLVVPDGEVLEGTAKINLKYLHEMFKNTNSHGLVSVQFLCTVGASFGLEIPIVKIL